MRIMYSVKHVSWNSWLSFEYVLFVQLSLIIIIVKVTYILTRFIEYILTHMFTSIKINPLHLTRHNCTYKSYEYRVIQIRNNCFYMAQRIFSNFESSTSPLESVMTRRVANSYATEVEFMWCMWSPCRITRAVVLARWFSTICII
jgi:hypothetical protein